MLLSSNSLQLIKLNASFILRWVDETLQNLELGFELKCPVLLLQIHRYGYFAILYGETNNLYCFIIRINSALYITGSGRGNESIFYGTYAP